MRERGYGGMLNKMMKKQAMITAGRLRVTEGSFKLSTNLLVSALS
jgi:hypothetical protein